MKVREVGFDGVFFIELVTHSDSRGFFLERWNKDTFAKLDFPEFVQDNFSRSHAGVVRGLHYQFDRPQGKLVTCLNGRIRDVLVDLRSKSPTYGRSFSIDLTGDVATWLWIPPGFAHGFSVLSPSGADVVYKVDQPYNPAGEGGIRWNDSHLNIDWGVTEPIMNARDQALPSFDTYASQPRF